ncbi:Threonyl/alanyl tRNA synthetase [Cokeromyces recurvatus]|uniref:Threonyl/alanyl tRNA synthetase n=1 Tax=Cokeromyces recurvatus TaxID=90255 RepID=UPI00221FDEBA|nr:Threonyl/alanyl tRNA synthetase [Cokeromyces recurvatus]KAI7906143.1 Threonyl/alanyl tRNA synthetase [Cokeromyces recurvatus]
MVLDQIPVGNLFCQRDTFARQLVTKCISCSEKPNKQGFYEVKLYDTVLFPEGGGQPSDTGYIDNVKVHNVQRQKLAHVHYTKEPITQGADVEVKLDWERRWDHVQQHSGQHLLSAVLERSPFFIETISWNLGERRSYIELPTAAGKNKGPEMIIQQELLQKVEIKVNELILQNRPVITHSQQADELEEHPDSLPDDYPSETGKGYIRTIEIKDLDKNPCCGTHVAELSQLQCFKILHTEKVRGGNTRVFFLFGQRVLDSFQTMYTISRQLTSLLSGPQEQFIESIQKIQHQSREHMKGAKRLLEQLAAYTVKEIEQALLNDSSLIVIYKEDGDMEFLNKVANIIRDRQVLEKQFNKKVVIVLAAGEQKTGGPIVVIGTENEIVQKTGKLVMKTLSGVKGGGKGRWQDSGAGIYSLLPFGLRTVEKIERIIDEEMQAIGGEKLSLPILLNPDSWKRTGRWDGAKGEVVMMIIIIIMRKILTLSLI